MAKDIEEKRIRASAEKRKIGSWILIGLFGILLLIGLGYRFGMIGIPKARIVTDIRKSQKVPESWTTAGETGKHLAAYVSYPEETAENEGYILSLYCTREGLSAGWHFRFGGGSSHVKDGIIYGQVADKTEELAYFSLNKIKAVKAVLYPGTDKEEIREIDPTKPFAMVIPGKAAPVFYDASGEELTCVGPAIY